MSERTALVVGAGGVLGAAVCAEFAQAGYRVVGLRRSLHGESGQAARFIACELADPMEVQQVASSVAAENGGVDVVVCNAAHLVRAPFGELSYADFESSWRVAVGSAFAVAQAVLPGMAARGRGGFIASGATASLRGTANFTAFAAAKFALRGLCQSLAREFQPAGVHVVHVVLDGLLRDSPAALRQPTGNLHGIDPAAVASIYRMLVEQPASAWTHELDLRPREERF